MTTAPEPIPEDPGQTNPGDEVPPGSPDSGEAVCPDCGGTGKVAGARDCQTCGGTGKVTQLIGDA
jgi:DnaJ-class molecular chaperone